MAVHEKPLRAVYVKNVKNLFRSSFFWFLVISALIFVINARVNNPAYELVVDDRVVARISALWESQMGRPPTKLELRNLTDNWVNEELLFREAKRLGLDEQDTIVKRRLIQKMHFLAEESEVTEPDQATLREWFTDNATNYKLPIRFTFSQIFYQDKPASTELELVNGLEKQAWRARGDASMHSPNFVQQSERQVTAEFGRRFAAGLSSLAAATQWQGPLQSEFGWHLIRLDRIDEAAIPTFEAVQHLVLNDYLYEQRSAAKATQLESLQATYKIRWVLTDDALIESP